MEYQHITSYKFIMLDNLVALRELLFQKCHHLKLVGTILLSGEGININVAGSTAAIQQFKSFIILQPQFADLLFKVTQSKIQPYRRLFVKVKKEIITLRQAEINPAQQTVEHLAPATFKQWLDEKKDVLVIDTRNEFEISYGTFNSAINLHLEQFSDFKMALASLDEQSKAKPIVIFCTGGIRCEKAGPVMRQLGYQEVYQLDGGIINYFSQCGRAHYQGECFVFDERIAITDQHCLKESRGQIA